MLVDFDVRGHQRMDFFIMVKLIFWPKTITRFKVKKHLGLFLTNMQLFTSQYVNWWAGVVWFTCGLLWCFYQLFGLILTAPIHCRGSNWWASDGMLNFSKSDEETNSSTSWLAWGWVHFHFWVNHSFVFLTIFKIVAIQLICVEVWVHVFAGMTRVRLCKCVFEMALLGHRELKNVWNYREGDKQSQKRPTASDTSWH